MTLDLQQTNTAHLRFEIEGMTCAGCVNRVERAILADPSVRAATVNLATQIADVETLAAPNLSEIVATIDATGYKIRRDNIILSIEGMSCASCVRRVETALLQSPAVISASVNLATETAHISVIAGQLDATTLVSLVRKGGYKAQIQSMEPTRERAQLRAQEITTVGRQTVTAFLLGLPVFLLAMGPHLVPALHNVIESSIGLRQSWLIQFSLTTLVLLWPGRGFLTKGFAALYRRAPDMNSLVAIGSSSAWIFSSVVLFAPDIIPEGSRGVYFEAAAVIVALILLGRWLEARAKGQTGAAIRRLSGLQPETALVERGGLVQDVPLDEIEVGDLVHLKPGGRVAVDGEVLSGRSFVDQSMISGEPLPVEKREGDTVIGGTINTTGALTFRACHVGRDTMLAGIIRMVENAQAAKLPIQALVDRVTAVFVPAVLLVAALTVLVWLLFGPGLSHALVAGVSVLIIACPCAMGLATPTSIMVGTGRGAELGILFRKGDALQTLSEVTCVAFDKTGTLTEGKPVLTDFEVIDGRDPDILMAMIAALETSSEHPIAQALVNAAAEQKLALPEFTSFQAEPGYGLSALFAGKKLALGADRYMKMLNVDFTALQSGGLRLAEAGKTPIYAAIDGEAVAVLAVADALKSGSLGAISTLKEAGIDVAMLTGDNENTAKHVAGILGIDHVLAEVLPKGKADRIKDLQTQLGALAFVGDGINDAPALASADVGIAIGTGTDVAIETADVVLMTGDVGAVMRAIALSRLVMGNIRQNLFWAFGYNILLIPVAAGALYPIFGILLSPMLAAAAMSLSSVFVLTNALRLRGFQAKGEVQ